MSMGTKAILGGVLALALLTPLLHGQAISEADRQRFEQIRAKHDRGEQVPPEEQKFAQSILARMNQAQTATQKQALPADLSDADRQRFEQIRAKVQRGEQPTPEERQFAQSILARVNQGQAAPKK